MNTLYSFGGETLYYSDERNLPSLPQQKYVPPSATVLEREREKDQRQIDFIRRSKDWFHAIYQPNSEAFD